MGGLMAVTYAREKFANAVSIMASGTGLLKERLYDAFLEFSQVADNDIPEHLRAEYRWIREELTKRLAKRRILLQGKRVERVSKQHAVLQGKRVETEGNIQDTLRTMRVDRAQEIARRIVLLADQLAEADDAA
jgi:hypothetical protein